MKKTMILVGMVLSLTSYSQSNPKIKKDSVYIGKQIDDMEGKTYYYASRGMVSKNEKQGFRLSCFIEGESDNELFVRDLSLKMVGIGGCVENNTLIIKFDDETKIDLKSWNDFNCDGDAWFNINEEQGNLLATKKIVKIKVQNGRTYDSYTADIMASDSDYFIQLYNAMKNKKIKIEKK